MPFKPQVLRLYGMFERLIVMVLLTLLMMVVVWATVMLGIEIVGVLGARMWGVEVAASLAASEFFNRLHLLHDVFGAFLLILIGLELMKTVVMYLDQNEIHVEVVLTVAMIAVARHAIDVNLAEIDPMMLFGMGALMVALALGHYFYKKSTALVVAATKDKPA